jgi:MurNAc alpha-1-phosphate uridylyltransferase
MILAAGRGTRLRPLTDDTPKPLLKVGELSLIEHLILKLKKHGFTEIVVNIAYLRDKIVNAIGNGDKYGVAISYSYEEAEGLETGGGIVNAMPLLGPKPFLVVSGDIWTQYPFSNLKTKKLEGLAHLVLVDNFKEHQTGDFYLLDGRLHSSTGTRLTFGNIGVYHPDFFADCTPGFFKLGPLLEKAAHDNQITGEHFQGEWENIGTPESLIALRKRVDAIE